MSDIGVRMIIRAYDQHFPLFRGEVPVPGVRLACEHAAQLPRDLPDGVDMAEVSFNRYIMAHARGDDDRPVGLPAFVLRGFRHRNFFVLAQSPLNSLAELRGRRVGTDSWPDSGTLWARAAMREAGVEIGDVRWTIGALDGDAPMKAPRAKDASPPADATHLADGDHLLAALTEGRIDAFTTAFAPDDVFRPGSWIRRLVPDYREVERGYRRRTGVYPAFHIVAARRSFALEHPQAVLAVYRALARSYEIWIDKTKAFAEASPWAMAELETMLGEFAGDSPPFGMDSAAHRRMVETMCQEQHAQGLVERPARPEELFADFDRLAAAGGA
jgi:4,5-dihydroxyphthalate decarboxylase